MCTLLITSIRTFKDAQDFFPVCVLIHLVYWFSNERRASGVRDLEKKTQARTWCGPGFNLYQQLHMEHAGNACIGSTRRRPSCLTSPQQAKPQQRGQLSCFSSLVQTSHWQKLALSGPWMLFLLIEFLCTALVRNSIVYFWGILRGGGEYEEEGKGLE